ncbi:iron-containing redox enzyme family protein [Hydrocarboniphaga sp.]|uniref:iron-containing redox enzyme family protein n=1 Tax=Hydrocarboniphaga sp. TaxID=2033016 RepID=UPI003D1084E7
MREQFASWTAHQVAPRALSPRELHLRLAAFNARRLRPALPGSDWRQELRADLQISELEGDYIESSRLSIAPLLTELPTDVDGFMQWFEGLRETGPGQHDALFPWLAEQATMPQMRWFLTQEIGGEAGFDDLVALTQVRLPTQAKLELARNYWDEMGRGREDGMHGPMLDQVAQQLDLQARPETTVWESLALANLMAAIAATRRYAYLSVGALGVVELTAPGRVALVNEGLRRLGVSAEGRRYFQLHAGLDVRHSEAWNREAIRPLVSADPALMRPIAEGALLRLRCGAACFERYRRELGVD